MSIRRISAINDTKIQFLLISDKIYKVTDIDFSHFTIEAKETDLSVGDVSQSELWDISEFEDFHVRLVNSDGMARVIDFGEWVERNKRCESK